METTHATELSVLAKIHLWRSEARKASSVLRGVLPTLLQNAHVWFAGLTLTKSLPRQEAQPTKQAASRPRLGGSSEESHIDGGTRESGGIETAFVNHERGRAVHGNFSGQERLLLTKCLECLLKLDATDNACAVCGKFNKN